MSTGGVQSAKNPTSFRAGTASVKNRFRRFWISSSSPNGLHLMRFILPPNAATCRLLRSQRQHWTGCGSYHLIGCRSEQRQIHRVASADAHHDQVSTVLSGNAENFAIRLAAHNPRCRTAPLAHLVVDQGLELRARFFMSELVI